MLLDLPAKGDKKGTEFLKVLIHRYRLCPVEAFFLAD